MRKFINRDFMLHGDTASRLYHEYAEHLPIIAISIRAKYMKIQNMTI